MKIILVGFILRAVYNVATMPSPEEFHPSLDLPERNPVALLPPPPLIIDQRDGRCG